MKSKIFNKLLISCDIITLSILVGPLLVEKWLYQSDEVDTWYGSLTRVTSDSEIWEDTEYKDLEREWCDEYNELRDIYYEYDVELDAPKALCITFKKLRNGGLAMIILSTLAMLCLVVKFITLVKMFRKEDEIWMSRIVRMLQVIMTILYAIGFIIWIVASKTRINGSCNNLYDGDDPAEVCADFGAKFGLFSMVFNILYTPMFILVIQKKWFLIVEPRLNPETGPINVEMRSGELPQSDSQLEPPIGIPLQQASNEVVQGNPAEGQVVVGEEIMKEFVIGYPIENLD